MTLENNYEQHWHLLEQHQKRQLSSTVIAQVEIFGLLPKTPGELQSKWHQLLADFLPWRTNESRVGANSHSESWCWEGGG